MLHRDALLDLIEELEGGEMEDELQEQHNIFHADVKVWQSLHSAVLAPLVEHAVRTVQHNRDVPSLPPFPKRNASRDYGTPEDGLAPPHNAVGQCDSWEDIFAVEISLPSAYSADVINQQCMREAVELEMELRRHEAERVLEDLRSALIACEILQLNKKSTVGKTVKTRIQARIQTANKEVCMLANHYRRHRCALLVLGMPEHDPQLRQLKAEHVKSFSMSSDAVLGRSKVGELWLWKNFSFVDSEADNHYQAFYDDGEQCAITYSDVVNNL